MSDVVIAHQRTDQLPGHGPVNLLWFHDGRVLMVTAEAVGLYGTEAALADPLGNGVLGFELIPPSLRPPWQPPHGRVLRQRAGHVALTSGAALFIRPDGVALYPSARDALYNQARQWLIPFGLHS